MTKNSTIGMVSLTAIEIVEIIKAMKDSGITELVYGGLKLKSAASEKVWEKDPECLTAPQHSPQNQQLPGTEFHTSEGGHRQTNAANKDQVDLSYLDKEYEALIDPLKFEDSYRLENSEA